MSNRKETSKAKRSRTLDRATILKAVAAHAATINARLTQRSADTANVDATIPQSVLNFLENLYAEPPLSVPNGKDGWADVERVAAIIVALRDAYRHGCREGYIEGFVARREPDRRRSRKANAAKRQTLVKLTDGTTMTRDERDALMFKEFVRLRELGMKRTPAMQRLAGKYGLDSWQGVDAAIKRSAARKVQ